MSWHQTKPIRASALCTRCGKKWRQYKGLCRLCSHEAVVFVPSTFEREAQHVAKQPVVRFKGTPVLVPSKTVVIEGVHYEVVWDGR